MQPYVHMAGLCGQGVVNDVVKDPIELLAVSLYLQTGGNFDGNLLLGVLRQAALPIDRYGLDRLFEQRPQGETTEE
jgi:hypothetical protein